MSQAADNQLVYVWVARVRGTKEVMTVRATRSRAERWVEEQVDDPEAEWSRGPGTKDLFRSDDATAAGMLSNCVVPDAVGLVVEEVTDSQA